MFQYKMYDTCVITVKLNDFDNMSFLGYGIIITLRRTRLYYYNREDVWMCLRNSLI